MAVLTVAKAETEELYKLVLLWAPQTVRATLTKFTDGKNEKRSEYPHV